MLASLTQISLAFPNHRKMIHYLFFITIQAA